MSAVVFAGDQVADFRAITLRKAIQLYLKTGIKPNRAYTAKNMAKAAGDITGLPYKTSKKSLQKAVDDIEAMYPQVFGERNHAKTA